MIDVCLLHYFLRGRHRQRVQNRDAQRRLVLRRYTRDASENRKPGDGLNPVEITGAGYENHGPSHLSRAPDRLINSVQPFTPIFNFKLIKPNVKVGDTVIFSKYGPDEIKIDGQEFYILNESSILAIVK